MKEILSGIIVPQKIKSDK
uniref:Uncharacterized protein n=1 Tax=Rhizophora mucronata TaxID=61149 RepID=A0A2P2NPJ3_RHIMU